MTNMPMVQVDVQRLYEDLRALLHQRFRVAFLERDWSPSPTRPSITIEAATRHFLHELPDTRREIQKIVGEHVTEGRKTRPQTRAVYVPELLKELVRDIGREAWARRYDGRVQIELKVQPSQFSLHQIRHLDATVHAPP